MVLSGHLHLGYVRRRGAVEPQPAGIAEAVEAGAHRRPILVVHAATATSIRRRDEPNGYNRITIEGGEIAIEPRVWTGRAWATELRHAVVPAARGMATVLGAGALEKTDATEGDR
jgi:hypothetical protein